MSVDTTRLINRQAIEALMDAELHEHADAYFTAHQRATEDWAAGREPEPGFGFHRPTRDRLGDELLRRGRERWGRGVATEGNATSTLRLLPGSPAAEEHGALTGLRLDVPRCEDCGLPYVNCDCPERV